jgi:hypothetical protein
MGRRKNNPSLVQELIDGRWTMDQAEFEEKYASLSSSDRSLVSDAIYGMEDELIPNDDESDDEALSVYDAALIWMSHGKDEDYMYGYTEEELEAAL